MDEEFLRYYNEELQYLRALGAEFAEAHPKVAGRLGIQDVAVSDPYVERLLEGFAFLTARVRLKQDAQFPRFTNHLLESVYPNFLSPMPSMGVVAFEPDPGETSLNEGFIVPRHSTLLSLLGRGEQTRTTFRTAHDVRLWPIALREVRYLATPAALSSVSAPVNSNVRAGISITLETTGGQRFSELPLDDLDLYLKGSELIPGTLYEQLIGKSTGIAAKPGTSKSAFTLIPDARVTQVGFDDAQSLLPDDGRTFGGYRLLQEYFAFPQRFMFAGLSGLRGAVQACDSTKMELMILLREPHSVLIDVLSTENFALFCSPVINLFERRADRIRLTPQTLEHHVLPDRTRPMDFEVWGVTEAKGIGESADESEPVFPLYASKDPGFGASTCYFVTQREPRMLSARQRRLGSRSSGYVGSEVFLSVVSASGEPVFERFKQLDVKTLCTNRDLPMQGSWGQGATDFDLQTGAPVKRIRCLEKPSAPRRSFAAGETNWRLINLLTVNYLSLVGEGAGAESIRELLRVFCAQGDATSTHQLDGLISVDSKGIAARLPVAGPQTFGRGIEIVLTLDESAFERGEAFLFSAVLERFFGRHVTLNSFTRTRVVTKQRNEIMQWPTRAGHRRTL